MNLKCAFIFLTSLLLQISTGFGQNLMDVRKYTTADGLNVGTRIKFDSQGFGWILPVARNFDQIQRFDGNRFDLIEDIGSTIDNANVECNEPHIIDKNGFLWLATNHGLFYFKNGQIEKNLTSKDGLPSDSVIALHSCDKGVFVVTKKGTALIAFQENKSFKVIPIDTIGFDHISWKWKARKEPLYLGLSGSAGNDVWFVTRLKSDSIGNCEFAHYTVNDELKVDIQKFSLPIQFTKFDVWNEKLLVSTNNGMIVLNEDGSFFPLDSKFKKYVGHDSKNRSYFLINKGKNYRLIRESTTDLTDFGRSNDYFEFSNVLDFIHKRIVFKEGILNIDDESLFIVDEDSLNPIQNAFPEFNEYLRRDYNYFIPGDGQIWAFAWGNIGALSFRLRKDVRNYRDKKEINGSKTIGFSKDKKTLYQMNDYWQQPDSYIFTGLNTENGTFKLYQNDRDYTPYYVSWDEHDRQMFSNLSASGNAWWWPKNKTTGEYLCYRIVHGKGLEYQPDLTFKMNANEHFDLCEIDNSWVFVTESMITLLDSNFNKTSIDIPRTIKPLLVEKMIGSEFILKGENELFAYYNDSFINLTNSLTEQPKYAFHMQNNGTTMIFSINKNFSWYTKGQIYYPDTVSFPILKHADRIKVDNLGRIIMYYQDDSTAQRGFCIISNNEYKFLPRTEKAVLRGIVLDYYNNESDNFIYYTSKAVYHWNENSSKFFKVFNYADLKGYIWSSLVLDNHLYMSGWGNSLLQIDLSEVKETIPKVILRSIHADEEMVPDSKTIQIEYGQRLSIEVYCPEASYYPQVQYQYRLNGEGKWSRPISLNRFDFESLLPGTHIIYIRALGESEVWGELLELEIKVKPPWYQTGLAYTSFGASLLALFFAGVRINSRRLRLNNLKLQDTVEKRTKELSVKNEEIMDSILYARRIQEAILPPAKLVKSYLTESFILYKPKDIVAGDFYWFDVQNDLVYFAAADCTGHGVPGAMVSVVCANALNRAVNELKLTEPAAILDKVRELVVQTFEKSEEEVKDGMDISFCKLDLKTRKLTYAGAHNPLYRVTQLSAEAGEKTMKNDTHMLLEYKGDKQPIGKWAFEKPFTQQDIQLLEGDSIYLSTDGYADQFGGENGKKFMYKPFKQLFLSLQNESMERQKEILSENFEKWKGMHEQVDDVCVIGVKV